MSKNYLLFILLFFSTFTIGQAQHRISGHILDSLTHEPLIGTYIIQKGQNTGTVSDNFGYFSLNTREDWVSLEVSYIGYGKKEFSFLGKDTILTVELLPAATLETVEVASNRDLIESQSNTIRLSPALINTLPAIGGEKDVLRSLQLLPGIQSGNEGSIGLNVRGGSPDQNLILLDDVPVYNAAHLFGFLSTINVDAINDISVIKGAFPTRFGGRLSSVLDISMKNGDKNQWHKSITLNPVVSKIYVNGPLKKEKLSIVLSARRTFLDLILQPLNRRQNKFEGISGGPSYFFYDIDTKVHYKASVRNNFTFSFHTNEDAYGDRETYQAENFFEEYDDNLAWKNLFAALRWNHLHKKSLFIKTVASYNQYEMGVSQSGVFRFETDSINSQISSLLEFKSKVEDFNLKTDITYNLSDKILTVFGVSGIVHVFEPGIKSYQLSNTDIRLDSLGASQTIKTLEVRAYGESQIRLNEHFKLNAGLHLSLYRVQQKNYHSLEPRVSLEYSANEQFNAGIGFSSMSQYIHLLSNSGFGLPTDLWVPVTQNTSPQRSDQVSFNTGFHPSAYYHFDITGYYKKMRGLITYKPGVDFLIDSRDWEDNIADNGHGTSYGVEVLIAKKRGRLQGFVSYTLSKTDRQFASVNNGEKYPYKYDRRHDLSLVGSWLLTKKWKMTGTWVYSTGYALSLPESVYPSPFYPYFGDYDYFGDELISLPLNYNNIHQPTEVLLYSEKNKYRAPAYHRLDIEFSHTKEKKKYTRILSFGLYNVYNHRNPYYITFTYKNDASGTHNSKGKFEQVSLLPVLPFVSCTFQF